MDYPRLASGFGTSNPFWFRPSASDAQYLAHPAFAKMRCRRCSENDSSAQFASPKNQSMRSCHRRDHLLRIPPDDDHHALIDTLPPNPWGQHPKRLYVVTLLKFQHHPAIHRMIKGFVDSCRKRRTCHIKDSWPVDDFEFITRYQRSQLLCGERRITIKLTP